MGWQLQDIFKLSRWEIQEAIGFFSFAQDVDANRNKQADFDIFNIHTPIIKETMKRDKLYRLIELNPKKGGLNEQQRKLYEHIIGKTKSNPTIHLRNIFLMDGVNYSLHYPCLITQEDGHWGGRRLLIQLSVDTFICSIHKNF